MHLKKGKTAKEYLKQGQYFYQFKLVFGLVRPRKVEFVGFILNKDEQSIPIFYDGDKYTQIKCFWRDFVLCDYYPSEGWYENYDECKDAGKRYFIERIVE